MSAYLRQRRSKSNTVIPQRGARRSTATIETFVDPWWLIAQNMISSGVGTGGSGGSMNRGPQAPEAPSSGGTEIF